MKLIDNFDAIKSLINFEKADNLFFMAQIVKRQKDHPGEKVREGAIATYYIRSQEQLENLRPEMIALSRLHGARVYINPSPKSIKKLQSMVAMELVRKMSVDEIDNPAHVTKSMAGQLKSKNPLWVIDVDDVKYFPAICDWLEENNRPWIYVPTLSYGHLLVKPFNKNEFKNEFPTVDLHENSMGTLLYYEKN